MRRVALILTCAAMTCFVVQATERVHHELKIELDPGSSHLRAVDVITFPAALHGEDVEFLLNADLVVVESDPAVSVVPLGDVEGFFGINAGEWDPAQAVPLARYRLDGSPDDGRLVLSYEGKVDYGLSDPKEEYTRGFRETSGILGGEGVFLAGNGFWYPRFDEGLIEFRLDIGLPEGWHVISQGNGSSRDADGRAHWESGGAMDEIYLCGGRLVPYREAAGAVEMVRVPRRQRAAGGAVHIGGDVQAAHQLDRLVIGIAGGDLRAQQNAGPLGVDQDVGRSEKGSSPLDHAGQLVEVAHITGHVGGTLSQRFYFSHSVLERWLLPGQRGMNHCRTRPGQVNRHGPSDSRAAACHKRDPVFQFK